MMSISVKGKYGLAATFQLALNYKAAPMQIRSIAHAQSIPQNYLEQLLVELKRAGIVKSFRGSQGGYVLAKSPEEIRVCDILSCLEGPLALAGDESRSLNFFWTKIEKDLSASFGITLSDLVEERGQIQKTLTYQI